MVSCWASVFVRRRMFPGFQARAKMASSHSTAGALVPPRSRPGHCVRQVQACIRTAKKHQWRSQPCVHLVTAETPCILMVSLYLCWEWPEKRCFPHLLSSRGSDTWCMGRIISWTEINCPLLQFEYPVSHELVGQVAEPLWPKLSFLFPSLVFFWKPRAVFFGYGEKLWLKASSCVGVTD